MNGPWSPPSQFALLANNNPAVNPGNLGVAVLQTKPKAEDKSLFYQSYVKPEVAKVDHAQARQNVVNTVDQILVNNPTLPRVEVQELRQLECEVFPPLLVRYGGPADAHIPVTFTITGELHKTVTKPMIILNFHASSAITATLCQLDKTRLPGLVTVIRTLYAMQMPVDVPDGLSIEQFTRLYDSVRMSMLNTPRV